MPAVALDGVLRRYDWGSTTALQQLLGLEPDGRPAAELWFGAHPDDPSTVPVHGCTLAELVDNDVQAALGSSVIARFGPRLPYLLKILAAGRALSIQVHPSREQARAGFAAEDAAGTDRGAPNRNYRDDNHKPELICALTTFDALCGFRPVEATLELLERLDLAELGFLRERLGGADPLRAATAGILEHPDPGPVVRALVERLGTSGDAELDGVRLAAGDFPDDVGIVLALLLNQVRLEPGEALFLPAGNVHAYLRGVGVEIMANSDNVLRCGLTGKHVDVPAVLAVTDFTALVEPRWPSLRGSYDVPVPDFRLVRVPVEAPMALDDVGPLIVLCTEGSLEVGGVPLKPGRAAFVPAADPVTLSGSGVAFVAGVGMLG